MNKVVNIPVDSCILEGTLTVPNDSNAVIIFAHGSGSNRLSKRNIYLASFLHNSNLGTLLFDLLTSEESAVEKNRFNISLLSNRLKKVTEWFIEYTKPKKIKIGYFGASTGAAASIEAACMLNKDTISAIV